MSSQNRLKLSVKETLCAVQTDESHVSSDPAVTLYDSSLSHESSSCMVVTMATSRCVFAEVLSHGNVVLLGLQEVSAARESTSSSLSWICWRVEI